MLLDYFELFLEVLALCLRVSELSLQVVDLEVLFRNLLGMRPLHSLLLTLESFRLLEGLHIVGCHLASIRLQRTRRRLHQASLRSAQLVVLERTLEAQLQEALSRLEHNGAAFLQVEEQLH